jgi:hypothetical protein
MESNRHRLTIPMSMGHMWKSGEYFELTRPEKRMGRDRRVEVVMVGKGKAVGLEG